MSIRKTLIRLNNRLESSWYSIDFQRRPWAIKAGWYIAEFVVNGHLDHTPRLVVVDEQHKERDRELVGAHAGRNRMLFYLPAGRVTAHSESLSFERLAKLSSFEARLRTLLICARYLRDFFGLKALFKMVALQFQAPFQRSTSLLQFYCPDVSDRAYLKNLDAWKRFDGFSSRILAWFAGRKKIAVVIENESQREGLESLLLAPDWIINFDSGQKIPGDADFVIPLHQTETLRSPAILVLKRAIKKSEKSLKMFYTDHDYQWSESSKHAGEVAMPPVFKPNPSRCYLACFNYVGPAVGFSGQVLSQASLVDVMDEQYCYRLALDLFQQTEDVLHVPEALFKSTRETEPKTPPPANENDPAPHIPMTLWPGIEWRRCRGYNVLVADNPEVFNAQGPSVDLVIPTRDGLAVLQPCVDGILAKTEYQNYQIIIVDNGSEKPETLSYFEKVGQHPNVKIVSYPGAFNYSAINNFAVDHGDSAYVGLINNDIEVIDGDWLTQMMAWVVQPDVGIVGAKLLFGDGRVQHAGVTIGMGNAAGHIHRLESGDAPGYQMRCLATQNMMAVTAACLITPRSLFNQLGGLNETDFKVAYNDIDYCLRVEASGQQVIWTPEAVLYHHESVSRGDDMSDQHIERYFSELQALQKRWKTKGFVDKYYSRHLRISDEGVFPQVEQERTDTLVELR